MLRFVDGLFMAMDEGPLSVQAAGVAYVCGDKVLLLRRASGDCAGTWAFPAGKIEAGETPAAAAARESQEEVGRAPDDLEELQSAPAFTLFRSVVSQPFAPLLNDEHDLHVWSKIGRPPAPLHPAVADQLKLLAPVAEDCLAADHYAFDKSVRKYDQDGRLRVEMANISKANVCEYRGEEIPGWEELGLQAKKLYKLYRDPDELAKAAGTFNGIPVLDTHVPSTAWDHPKGRVIGATGSSTEFKPPYLRNSLVIWTQEAIDDIESRRQRELSCGYRYRADMTPGKTPGGEAYDGVMRDILGNHVAVVAVGRAGPDVIIGDSRDMKAYELLAVNLKAVAPGTAPHELVSRNVLATDVEWDESKHKRAANGQFGSGGSSAKAKAPAARKNAAGLKGAAENDAVSRKAATEKAAREKSPLKAGNLKVVSGGIKEPSNPAPPQQKNDIRAQHAENVERNAKAQAVAEEPQKVKEKPHAQFVHEFLRENPTQAEMKAALKTRDSAHLQKALGLMDKAGNNGAATKLVRDLINAELAGRKEGAAKGKEAPVAAEQQKPPPASYPPISKSDSDFIKGIAEERGHTITDEDARKAHAIVSKSHTPQDYYYGMKDYFS